MEVQRSVSSWWVPPAISACACASTSSGDSGCSGALSSGGGGCCCLRLRLDLEFALVSAGGRPKPSWAGGALRRPVSTLARARSARKFMLLMISSRRDCVVGGLSVLGAHIVQW